MARELESQMEAYLFKKVRLLGGMAIKLCPNVAGLPDRLVLFPGSRVYFLELKTVTGHLRTAQVVLHSRLVALGSPVYVLHGKAEVDAWLGWVVDGMNPDVRTRAYTDPVEADL